MICSASVEIWWPWYWYDSIWKISGVSCVLRNLQKMKHLFHFSQQRKLFIFCIFFCLLQTFFSLVHISILPDERSFRISLSPILKYSKAWQWNVGKATTRFDAVRVLLDLLIAEFFSSNEGVKSYFDHCLYSINLNVMGKYSCFSISPTKKLLSLYW